MTDEMIMTPNEVRSRLGLPPQAELRHIAVSTKPWSDFKAADYTPEQYKAACLIVRGDGSSKAMCKLPVREPSGALNRAGMAAAAGALGGARGNMMVSSEEKASAKTKLKALYKQIGEDPPASLMHSDVEDFLEHVGVKGMRWGVRKSDSPSARSVLKPQVKAGTATIGQAHQAAIKSTGHRAANFVLGDKTYWKNTAKIVGVTFAAIGVAAIPGALPAAALSTVASGILTAGNAVGTANLLTNSYRAVFGNRRINANMQRVGGELRRRQQSADAKTQRILSKYGSLPKSKLHHAESSITHAENATVQEVWDSLSPEQLDTMETIIGLSLDETNAEGVVVDTDVYNSMTPIQRDIATFVMGGAMANAESSMAQSDDMVDNFLAHFGRLGMKWGRHIFTSGDSTSSGTPGAGGTKKPASAEDPKAPVHLSADAERFIRTHQKAGVEMSDREMKEALQRANLVKQYDDLFNAGPNKALRDQVEAMQLQISAAQLRAQMKGPTKLQKIDHFVSTANKGFEAYNKLNKATDGALNKKLGEELGPLFKAASKAQSASEHSKSQARAAENIARQERDFFAKKGRAGNSGGIRFNPGGKRHRSGPDPIFKVTNLP